MNYIEINKDKIPHNFNVTIGAEIFNIAVNYNKREDTFTIDLSNADGEVLVRGEPLIYGEPLFKSIRNMDFPILAITPKDLAMEVGEITYENLNETVFLVVGDE